MRPAPLLLATSMITTLGASIACAHHSAVMYERGRQVELEGTIEEYKWMNPHSYITIIVPAEGKTPSMAGKWDVEGAAVNIMTRQGWNKLTFKRGDKITVVGYPMRDGSKGVLLNYAIDANGRRLWHDVGRTPGPNDPPAPKAP